MSPWMDGVLDFSFPVGLVLDGLLRKQQVALKMI